MPQYPPEVPLATRAEELTAAPPTLLRAVLAPWTGILRPSRAAATWLHARRPDFVIAFTLHVLFLALTIVCVTPTGVAPTLSGGGVAWPPAEVRLFVIAAALTALGAAGAGWLFLPAVHRTGAVWKSYERALRATASSLGVVIATLWTFAVCVALGPRNPLVWFIARLLHANLGPVLFPLIAGSLWAGVIWLGRAVRAAQTDLADLGLPPRCEGCGYDLTHRAADGRCTECGLDVDASLTPDRLRPGSAWMRLPQRATWLATTWTVLFTPGRFYQALRLRTPGATERSFASWHYAAIVAGAALWASLMVGIASILHGPPPNSAAEVVLIVLGFSLSAGLGCWAGHRFIAAAVVSWWLARNALPDGRWAAKVIAYESAFLWSFCIFWGLLIASFLLFADWISQHLVAGHRWGLLLPAEAWAVFIGTCVLGAVWLWRYHVAYRSIRWSNF